MFVVEGDEVVTVDLDVLCFKGVKDFDVLVETDRVVTVVEVDVIFCIGSCRGISDPVMLKKKKVTKNSYVARHCQCTRFAGDSKS